MSRRDFPLLVEDGEVRLERWKADRHTAGLTRACADAEVMRFLGGRPMTPSEARDVSRRIEEHWERDHFGLWAVVVEGETLGFAGVCRPLWHAEYADDVEVGWRLARPAWGRGLATLGGRAGVDAAFEHLGLRRVIAFVHPENQRSLAVTERLGMERFASTIDPRLGAKLEVLEVARPPRVAGP